MKGEGEEGWQWRRGGSILGQAHTADTVGAGLGTEVVHRVDARADGITNLKLPSTDCCSITASSSHVKTAKITVCKLQLVRVRMSAHARACRASVRRAVQRSATQRGG